MVGPLTWQGMCSLWALRLSCVSTEMRVTDTFKSSGEATDCTAILKQYVN